MPTDVLRGANLILEIEPQGGNTAPSPSRVHVVRTDEGALDDAANHFAWSPVPFSAVDAQSERVAFYGGFFLTRPNGWCGRADNLIQLAAGNGPHWGGNEVIYELVAEFEGGLLLKSEPQLMMTTS